MSGFNSLMQLTERSHSEDDRRRFLREFAAAFGWQPSDEILNYGKSAPFSSGHLIVEHGLDNTAVITILHRSFPFTSLSLETQTDLISISYNNLVDWHLFPDAFGLLRIYNRIQPLKTHYITLAEEPAAHRAEYFDRVSGRLPNPNLPALEPVMHY